MSEKTGAPTDFVTLTVCIATISAAVYYSNLDHTIIVSV